MNNVTYEEFIQNILDTRGRFACGDEYHERHHITPKCFGGTNDEVNLIDLFAKEHFVAHKILAEENPENEKLVYAWWCMCTMHGSSKKRYNITPEEYEQARIHFAKMARQRMKGTGNPNYGKQSPNKGKALTDEHKKKLSKARKGKYTGEQSPLYGKPGYHKGKHFSDETRKKQSESAKASWTEERRAKQSGENNPFFGKSHTKETREKIGLANTNTWTEERRKKQSEKSSAMNSGENHPMWGKHLTKEARKKQSDSHKGIYVGEKNPRAKKVVRLFDGKIYECGKYAAEENAINYTTFKGKCKRHDGFMYYDEWLTIQNNYENTEDSND